MAKPTYRSEKVVPGVEYTVQWSEYPASQRGFKATVLSTYLPMPEEELLAKLGAPICMKVVSKHGAYVSGPLSRPTIALIAKHGLIIAIDAASVSPTALLFEYETGKQLPATLTGLHGYTVRATPTCNFWWLVTGTVEEPTSVAAAKGETPAKRPVVIAPRSAPLMYSDDLGGFSTALVATHEHWVADENGKRVIVDIDVVVQAGAVVEREDICKIQALTPRLRATLEFGGVTALLGGFIVGKLRGEGAQRIWTITGNTLNSPYHTGDYRRLYNTPSLKPKAPVYRPLMYDELVGPRGHFRYGGVVPKNGEHRGMCLRLVYAKPAQPDQPISEKTAIAYVGVATPRGVLSFSAEDLLTHYHLPSGKPVGKLVTDCD